MAAFFPPGDIRFDIADREHCLWRELSFALHLIRQAINPILSLSDCLAQWNRIAADLAEANRKRGLQLENIYEFEELLG